jgi:programmed cell death 6-interacting protein
VDFQIQLEIAYAPVFAPDDVPIKLMNLMFERAALIFNLAALYSQLAEHENRNHIDGIKQAINSYQVRFLAPHRTRGHS